MMKRIEDAIDALEKKPAEAPVKTPRTGDGTVLWFAALFINCGVCAVLNIKRKKL